MILRANQVTDFYMMATLAFNELTLGRFSLVIDESKSKISCLFYVKLRPCLQYSSKPFMHKAEYDQMYFKNLVVVCVTIFQDA